MKWFAVNDDTDEVEELENEDTREVAKGELIATLGWRILSEQEFRAWEKAQEAEEAEYAGDDGDDPGAETEPFTAGIILETPGTTELSLAERIRRAKLASGEDEGF